MENKETKFIWTTSKVLSYLMLFAGFGLSIYLKSEEPFLAALLYSTINQGVKNISQHMGELKKMVKK